MMKIPVTILFLLLLIPSAIGTSYYGNYSAFGRENIDVLIGSNVTSPDIGKCYYSGAYHPEDIGEQICIPTTGKHSWKLQFQPSNAYRGYKQGIAYNETLTSAPAQPDWNYTNADSKWNNNLTAVIACSTDGMNVDYVAIKGYDIVSELPEENITADFNATPLYQYEGNIINFYDNSTGGDAVNWSWYIEGNSTPQATTQNPAFGFNDVGDYDVMLYACSENNCDWENKTDYVHILSMSSQHIDLDVKDANTMDFINDSTIGIFEHENNQWRNSTCVSGACGFMDAGTTHQYPLQLGDYYIIAASHPDYNPTYTNISYTQDHQLVTLLLVQKYGNETIANLTHLDIDVKEATTHNPIENPSLNLYDTVDGDWYNTTCENPTGTCGFVHSGTTGNKLLVYGRQYIINAQKDGFMQSTKTITFYRDHQLEIMYLNSTTGGYKISLNLDVKDTSTGSYLQGADTGIYDPLYNEWRNATCIYGACGFQSSGSTMGKYPLVIGNTYTIAAWKTGYGDISQVIKLSEDGQLFTLWLSPVAQNNSVIPTRTFVTMATPYPQLTALPSTNVTLDVSFIEITLIPTLDTGHIVEMPEELNGTTFNTLITTRSTFLSPILILESNIGNYIMNFIIVFSNICASPLMTVINFGLFIENAITVIAISFSPVIDIIVDIMSGIWLAMPYKAQLVIFFMMAIDTIFVIWNFGKYLRIYGGG